jgi:hypothetical protein
VLRAGEERASKPVSRILCPDIIGMAIIRLAPSLLVGSSDLPESHRPVAAVDDHLSVINNSGDQRSPLQSLAERVAPPLLFGLAPCGVCPALGIATKAVRSYIEPPERPHLFTLTRRIGRYIFCGTFHAGGVRPRGDPPPTLAVNEHTTLRSSDFPLPRSCLPASCPCGPKQALARGSDRPACSRCFYDSVLKR